MRERMVGGAAIRREIEKRQNLKTSFLECIKTFLKIKCDIYAVSLPTITITEGGDITHGYKFTQEQQTTLKHVDKAIASIQRSHKTMLKNGGFVT